MKLLYFQIKNIKKWAQFFILSVSCSFVGIIVSSYIFSVLSDETAYLFSNSSIVTAVFLLLFINGHLFGERLLLIQETKDEQGNVVHFKSGVIVVFWIIVTTASTKLCGLLFLQFGIVDERNILLPWSVVVACTVAILALILFGAFSRNPE